MHISRLLYCETVTGKVMRLGLANTKLDFATALVELMHLGGWGQQTVFPLRET